MSGVYIKGMTAPRSCAECLDIGWNYVFECNLDDVESGEKRADCPLLPVPPHGRLIDADALIGVLGILGSKGGSPVVWQQMRYIAEDMPTIIPASKEDEE